MKCKAYAQGRLTKKVYSFIQAFISFCLISISSIEDKVIQYDFYLLTAQGKLLKSVATIMNCEVWGINFLDLTNSLIYT